MTKGSAREYPFTPEELGYPWGHPAGMSGPAPAEQEAQKIPLLVNLPDLGRREPRLGPFEALALNEARPALDFSTGAAPTRENKGPRETLSTGTEPWYVALDRNEYAAVAMAGVLELPRESIRRAPDGLFVYEDGLGRQHSFGTMRAVRAGRSEFTRVEYLTWKLRLAVEAGLAVPAPVSAPPLPNDAHPVVRKVDEGFLLLCACRWLHTPGAPAPFSRTFAAPWCSVSEHEARWAIDELRRLGLIYQAGQAGKLRLWLPANEGTRGALTGEPGPPPPPDFSSCRDGA